VRTTVTNFEDRRKRPELKLTPHLEMNPWRGAKDSGPLEGLAPDTTFLVGIKVAAVGYEALCAGEIRSWEVFK